MGTRGAYGFHYNGQDYITYNHYDSYPTGLGHAMINFIEATTEEEMLNIVKNIILVIIKIFIILVIIRFKKFEYIRHLI